MGDLILKISFSILLLSCAIAILAYSYLWYEEAEYDAMCTKKMKKELKESFKLNQKPEE